MRERSVLVKSPTNAMAVKVPAVMKNTLAMELMVYTRKMDDNVSPLMTA